MLHSSDLPPIGSSRTLGILIHRCRLFFIPRCPFPLDKVLDFPLCLRKVSRKSLINFLFPRQWGFGCNSYIFYSLWKCHHQKEKGKKGKGGDLRDLVLQPKCVNMKLISLFSKGISHDSPIDTIRALRECYPQGGFSQWILCPLISMGLETTPK